MQTINITNTPTTFGHMLKQWRHTRGQSQMDLGLNADVSQRHISFIETGRSRPGEDIVHKLTEALDVPLRERNSLYIAAGFPPLYPDIPLDDPFAAPFRTALTKMLETHEPYPAYVVDRWWNIIDANKVGHILFPNLTGQKTPPNAVDAFFSPGPMQDMLDNLPEVAAQFHTRLKNEVLAAPNDIKMQNLLKRFEDFYKDIPPPAEKAGSELIICPRLRVGDMIINTVTMIAQFSHTRAVNLHELRVELVYPADEEAEQFFRMMSAGL